MTKRRAYKRTVKDALNHLSWISDIQGAIMVGGIAEFVELWDILSEIVLQLDVENSHVWRLSVCGQYSVQSTYMGFFFGSITFRAWERI